MAPTARFIGLFAKVFSYTERFDHQGRSLERWLRRVTLEQGLVAGAGLALIGLAGDVWVLWCSGNGLRAASAR